MHTQGLKRPDGIAFMPPACLRATAGTSNLTLLNITERHLSISHELPIALALLTTRLLQSMVGGCRGS
jgi:hypothetical protein